MDLDWVRDIAEQCADFSVPLFVKQLGSRWAAEQGMRGKGNDPDLWPEDLRIRQMPERLAAVA